MDKAYDRVPLSDICLVLSRMGLMKSSLKWYGGSCLIIGTLLFSIAGDMNFFIQLEVSIKVIHYPPV